MAYPFITANGDGNATAAFVSATQSSGLNITSLGAIAQLQLAVANLMLGEPPTGLVPAANVTAGTFGAGAFTFQGALTAGAASFTTLAASGAVSSSYFNAGATPSAYFPTLAVGGDGTWYNHVLVCAGLGAHPLLNTHQVAFYAPILGNSYATGAGSFIAGFESAIGTVAGAQVVERAAAFTVGTFVKGAGTTITRLVDYKFAENTAGTNNAAFANDADSATFTGDWLIYYTGARPTALGTGVLTLGREISRAVDNDFIRLAGGTVGIGASVLLYGSTHATLANTATITGSAGVTIASNTGLAVPAENYRESTNSYVRLFGGTFAAAGANVLIFGSTHANANQMQLTASGGLTIAATTGITGSLTAGAISGTTGTFSSTLAVTSWLSIAGAAATQAAGVLSIGNTTQTTVGAAGAASALPPTPTGYIKTYIGATQYVIPYYAQA